MKVGPGNQISSILDNVCGHSTLGKGKKSIATLDFLHILPFFTQIMPYFVRNHKYKVVLLWKTDLETNFRQHSTMYMVTATSGMEEAQNQWIQSHSLPLTKLFLYLFLLNPKRHQLVNPQTKRNQLVPPFGSLPMNAQWFHLHPKCQKEIFANILIYLEEKSLMLCLQNK